MYSRFESVCESSGGGVSEDVLGHIEGETELILWVIDGATGLNGAKLLPGPLTDAAWYARQISAAFGRMQIETSLPLSDRVEYSICDANRVFRSRILDVVPPETLPSASLVCVMVKRASSRFFIEVAALGDCSGAINVDGATHSIASTLGASFDDVFRSLAMYRLRASNDGSRLSVAQHKIDDEITRRRKTMNQPDGYSIAAPNLAFGKVVCTRFETAAPPTVLLCSDGASRLVDQYQRYTWSQVLERARTAGIVELLRELRSIEDGDSDCATFPRLKGRDDATMIYACVA